MTSEHIPTTEELRPLLGPLTFAVRVIHSAPVDSVENERAFSSGSSTPSDRVVEPRPAVIHNLLDAPYYYVLPSLTLHGY